MKQYWILIALFSQAVYANTTVGRIKPIEPESHPLRLAMGVSYLDDLNPTYEANNGGMGYVVSGKGLWVNRSEGIWSQLNVTSEAAKYSSQAGDMSAFDLAANARVRTFISTNWALDTVLYARAQKEAFGQGLSLNQEDIAIQDEYLQHSGRLTLLYGADTESRYLALSIASNKTNYRESNDYAQLFDRNETMAQLQSSFALSDRTFLEWVVEYWDLDYRLSQRPDSETLRGLAGVTWRGTGKSNLSIKIGSFRMMPKNQDPELSGLSWDLGWEYFPTENLEVLLKSYRRVTASLSEDAGTDVTSAYKAQFLYNYSERWFVGASAQIERIVSNDLLSQNRINRDFLTFWVDYRLHEQNKITLQFDWFDKASTQSLRQFDQSGVALKWQVDF